MRSLTTLTLITGLALTGCANFAAPSKSRTLDSTQVNWISYDASRRGTIVQPASSPIKTCAEPAPDIALTLVNSLKGSIDAAKTDINNIDATVSATVVALAGRNELVLVTRESLFRICEAHMNGAIQKDDVKELIAQVLSTITTIADTEKSKQEKEKAASITKSAEINLKIQQLKQENTP